MAQRPKRIKVGRKKPPPQQVVEPAPPPFVALSSCFGPSLSIDMGRLKRANYVPLHLGDDEYTRHRTGGMPVPPRKTRRKRTGERDRNIVALFDRGLTSGQLADRLGMTVAAVKKVLSRAGKKRKR